MWKTTVIALLVLLRITTGHAGIITLENENREMASVRVVLSTYIGADDSKIGEVITNVGVVSSYRSKEYAYITEHATNPAYQCELAEGQPGKYSSGDYTYPNGYKYPNDIRLQVRKLQAGYAGEATCTAEVVTMAPYNENWGYTNYYVYNTITAPSAYGPSFATLLPSGVKVTLPKAWQMQGYPGYWWHAWNDKSNTFRKAVKWSATYDDQIQHDVSESHPYVPILTVTDDSDVWAYVAIIPKDVDAGFTAAVNFRMKDGRPCDRGMGAGDQCLMYVNKDKLKPGVTKGLVVLNVQLP
ncbi:hypothetical protein H0I68_10795 [Yersinia kristensenii]|uniref:hypothetical protein n=1 Tax=Yersinia kristensenii TaxID=28152 RepID=UPI000B6A8E2D|nr:hypothetical protein [Yersinia kristensenii]MBW5812811.1 hypothetical protein [Yersinia kristensenii]MBW5816360.1 hypothetical protein [Yersinia kristensenii]MBW5825551.1 hypothetical protein [Yersinia kristensenii]MBW5830112.1 hypothetical protein [Yersinia kristensenii]MBW5841970.1 hypothetical protein [Yersinia kristensenii]